VIVVWSPQAIEDVERIAGYISAENPIAAVQVARELLLAGDSLATFPRRGRPSALPGRRELVAIRPYLIVYRILNEDTVDMLRVWHGTQDRS
jgi:addiction module RelE/StbE family toxin